MNSNMIKVLIVDDEHLVRSLLKRCIDWNSIGMEIIGEASSGEAAIDLVDEHRPDLIFTDICMTNMDGIEFADFILKVYPNIKIVVISGYDDFKYAQRGIKAGIKDYLLKPIDDEVLLNIALKMKKEIEEERESISEYTILKKQFIENLPFLKERLFNRLIHTNTDINEVRRQMDYLNFRFKYDNFQVAVIEIILDKQDNYKKEETIYENKILEKLKEYLEQYEDINIFFDNNYRITIINNGQSGIFEKAFDNIRVNVLGTFDCYYCIGIGTIINGMENIQKSYKEALEALNYRMIPGEDSIINYNKTKRPNKLIDDIIGYVRLNLGDCELSLSKIAQVFFINPSYLSRTFKKEMEVNLMEYLVKLRIDKAMLLLNNTDLKAYEIGEKVGISDSSYFSTCFKRYAGVSVSEYKKVKISKE